MANLANSNQDLYNLSLLAKSLESMLLLWEQHLNAIPEGDESASRLRSTANAAGKDARSSVRGILEVSQMLQAWQQEGHSAMSSLQGSASLEGRHRFAAPDSLSPGGRSTVSIATFHDDASSRMDTAQQRKSMIDSQSSLEFDDGDDAPEIDDTKPPSWLARYIIFPGWTSKLVWDLVVMMIVLMDAFVLPFQLSFKRDYGEDTFDDVWFWITTLCFSADIIVTFDTGLTVAGDDQEVITDHGVIARAYMRGWFSLDFVSTMPWSRIVDAFVGSDGAGPLLHVAKLAKMLKFLRIIRLMKMLRAKKIKDIWERLEIRIGSVTVIQAMYLVRVLLVIVAICHWNACIFWMIGRPDSIITDFLPDATRLSFERLPHWTTISRSYGIGQEEWSFAEKPMVEAYIFCFYWTLGVMRTMPAEVTPVNLAERTFVLCFMFFALSAFAVSVASLTQTYFKISERNRGFKDEMFALRMHMHHLKLDDASQRKIKDYITHLFTGRRIMAKELNFLQKLPEELKKEVEFAEVWLHLQKLSVLSEIGKEDIRQICEEAETMDHMADYTLCTAGWESKCAYIVISGHVNAKDIHKKPRELVGHPLIIDEACLEKEEPVFSPLTVVTASTCRVIRVGKLKFAKVVGMNLSKKRQDLLALSERPNQIELKDSIKDANSGAMAAPGAAAAAVMSA